MEIFRGEGNYPTKTSDKIIEELRETEAFLFLVPPLPKLIELSSAILNLKFLTLHQTKHP